MAQCLENGVIAYNPVRLRICSPITKGAITKGDRSPLSNSTTGFPVWPGYSSAQSKST